MILYVNSALCKKSSLGREFILSVGSTEEQTEQSIKTENRRSHVEMESAIFRRNSTGYAARKRNMSISHPQTK